MKLLKRCSATFLLMACMSIISASALDSVAEPIELFEDYPISYRVPPTREVYDFLSWYGIDISLPTGELGIAIGRLDTILIEDDVTGEISSAGALLNTLITGLLMAAAELADTPYFMSVGGIRWAIIR